MRRISYSEVRMCEAPQQRDTNLALLILSISPHEKQHWELYRVVRSFRWAVILYFETIYLDLKCMMKSGWKTSALLRPVN